MSETIAEEARRLHVAGHLSQAEALYRQAIGDFPEDVVTRSNLGLLLLRSGAVDDAAACLRTALRLDPGCAEAHNALGLMHYTQAHVAEAENCFRAALRLRPDLTGAMTNLGVALQTQNRLSDAEVCYDAALGMGGDPVSLGANLAMLRLEQGRAADAVAACREVLRLRPDSTEAQINLAMALLRLGNFAEGWAAYEARWRYADMTGDVPATVAPRWMGEPLSGRTLLLHAEQGFGDSLQFCRYAIPLAEAGADVVLAVQPALLRVLSRLHPAVRVVSRDEPLPPHDLWCPLMSLPLAFGTTVETIPAWEHYLTPEPELVAAWGRRLATAGVIPGLVPGTNRGTVPGSGPRARNDRSGGVIGLVWAGSSRDDQPRAAAVDRRRSMPLRTLAPLFDVPHCRFISLQLGPAASQIVASGLPIEEVSADLTDFAETASLIAHLDLVISVDTAVAHLAAALGKPVWLLNRFDTCWRWLQDRDDSPWYRTLRLFRQPEAGDWVTPVGAVAAALESRGRGSRE